MFDTLSRNTIGSIVTVLVLIATLAGSTGYIATKKDAEVGKNIIETEDAIAKAVVLYMKNIGAAPAQVSDLLNGGYISSSAASNGDGGSFSFVVDQLKNTLSITTVFEKESVLSSFLDNIKAKVKPIRIGMSVTATYPLDYTVIAEKTLQIIASNTPPDPTKTTRWYDTSISPSVLKIYDDTTHTWKKTKDNAIGAKITVFPNATALAQSAPPLGGSEERYVYDAATNTVQSYIYYEGKWIFSGGGSTIIGNYTMGSAQTTRCPQDFVLIPNSQNLLSPSGIASSPIGWCIAKYEMSPLNTAGWTKDATSKGWKFTSDTSSATNLPVSSVTSKASDVPINYISWNEAESACQNNLVSSNGVALSGGHLPFFGLWKVYLRELGRDNRNWSTMQKNVTGFINSGVRGDTNGVETIVPTVSDDNQGCAYSGGSCYGTTNTGESWFKRTHYIGDNIVWDLGGNVNEYMYEHQVYGLGDGTYTWYDYHAAYAQSAVFNSRKFMILVMSYWNGIGKIKMGQTYIPQEANLTTNISDWPILMGGGWKDSLNVGAFAIELGTISSSTGRRENGGFRCIVPAY